MTLMLVGTGIAFDLTLSAIEELKKCDEIYIEKYTNLIENGKIKSLEDIVGKKIIHLERIDVESEFLLKKAKNLQIALLSSGDPLIATTHIVLILDAKKQGTETKIIHNSSIYTTAAGKCGLQIYKFGKTCTIPNPREHYIPTSWFDIIRENFKQGMHTLVLLDTEPEPMDAKKAIELIINIDKDQLVRKIIVLSRIGWNDERITYGNIEHLKNLELGKTPFTLIISGKLHAIEEEFLNSLK